MSYIDMSDIDRDAAELLQKARAKRDSRKREHEPKPLGEKERCEISNYTEVDTKRKGNKRITEYYATPIADIRKNLLASTGNWPRMVGSTMFVFQPTKGQDEQRYLTIDSEASLFAWLREDLEPRWKSGNGGAQDCNGITYVTKKELLENLRGHVTSYQGVSRAPHYPTRSDIFYDHEPLPPPSEDHMVFWGLMDFFCLANDVYKTLAACFFCAPMFYKQGADRPMWVVDTVDAQASGKTSLVKMVAKLYSSECIDIPLKLLRTNPDEILKRILSARGRQMRIALTDNVTDTAKSDTLSGWVTNPSFNGRAAYGHGTEARINDLTFAVTANGCEVDTDMASRSYFVKVRKREGEYISPRLDEFGNPKKWSQDVGDYIEGNRLQLYADVVDMLKAAKPRPTKGRFPAFDSIVLSGVCRSDEEYAAAMATIEADALRANVDVGLATDFTEAVTAFLTELVETYKPIIDTSRLDLTIPTMISNAVILEILSRTSGKLSQMTVKEIRDLLKGGLAPKFSRRFKRLGSNHGSPRPEAVVFGVDLIPDGATETRYQMLDMVHCASGRRACVVRDDIVMTATIA